MIACKHTWTTLMAAVTRVCCSGCIALLMTSSAHAAFLAPVGVTANGNVQSNAVKENMTNHNGLAADGTHANAFAPQNHWRTTSAAATLTQTFDLGARFDLDSMRVWNYNESGTGGGGAPNTDRGVNNVDVSFSYDNVTFFGTQNLNLSQASGAGTYAGVDYALTSTPNARYVKFDVNTSHGSNNGFTGLSEVRFNTTTPQIAISGISTNLADDPNFGPEDLNGGGFTNYEGQIRSQSGDFFNKLWRDTENFSGGLISGVELTFDLGVDQNLNLIKVWNYNESGQTDRSIKDLQIWVSDDDISYTQVGGTRTLSQARDAAIASDQDILRLNPTVNARYVQFRPLNNYGDAVFYGLGEVQFFNVVPEPSTFLLAVLGLLALGLRRRRRQR